MQLSSLIGFQEPKTLTYINKSNPDEAPLLLSVHSTDSKIGKNAMREMQLSIFTAMKDEKNVVENDGVKNLKNELLNELGVNYISYLVVDWNGLVDEKNNEVLFDRVLLKEMIENTNDLGVEIDAFSRDIEGKFRV